MTIETSSVKITLSAEDMEILTKAQDMLQTVANEIDKAADNGGTCIVTKNDQVKLDNEEIWNAYVALDNLIFS